MNSYNINCQGRLISLDEPIIMGIINVTPDSFFTQGKASDLKGTLHTANNMLEDGAKILDIGGMSTRPGSQAITTKEEIDRVVPVIEQIIKYFPEAIISVDTYKSEVAKASFEYGASIINDISAGLLDHNMLATVGQLGTPYIAMHMQGNPQMMQLQPSYDDITLELGKYFSERIIKCHKAGIKDIILDPGFGFGKTATHNYTLLREMSNLLTLGLPILAGISRKSMLYKPLGIQPDNALNATTAAHMLCLQQGAKILRVHDVREAKESIQIWKWYQGAPIS